MEDALEQLDALARRVGGCTRCSELAARRLRAVPGGGDAHAAVLVVSLSPSVTDEAGEGPAGGELLAGLAEYLPGLGSSDRVYCTTLAKCVGRGDSGERPPAPEEQDNCFDHLSRELSITTPHYILAVGEPTARYLLRRLFRTLPYAPGDALELRVFDNPAFKVVPVATPAELAERGEKERKTYRERLRQLGQLMGV